LQIEKIASDLRRFAGERDWEQFHTPKNLATSITVEASELLEIFQWTRGQENWNVLDDQDLRERVENEVADVMLYLIRFADLGRIDLEKALQRKMQINGQKYPVEKSKGSDRKYNE
jgi:dCTP diphosphatase